MRPRPETLALLRAIVGEVTEKPVRELALETPVSDLGIDSVSIAEIVTRLEETLGIEISGSEWVRVRTLRDLVKLIDQADRD